MIRESFRSYIEHHDTSEWELYDLASDPHQLTSLRDGDVSGLSRTTGGFSVARPRAA